MSRVTFAARKQAGSGSVRGTARGPLTAALRIAVLGLALGGCVSIPADAPPFDAEQKAAAKAQLAAGSGTVTGYAFYHADSGRTYTAGGDWVLLVPVTPYAEARVRAIYGDSKVHFVTLFGGAPAGDPDYEALVRRTKADIHGRFTFEGVRPGRWFVAAAVKWQRADLPYLVTVYDEIEVRPNETTKVVLSGK